MEYQKKEDNYEDYTKYSNSVLKNQPIPEDGPVQGYASGSHEEQENYAPVETLRMKNTDGQFSVGVNRNKEATIAITSDAPGPSLRGDRSIVTMDQAKRVKEVPDKIYTNSHDERVSGIVYKVDLVKSPGNLLKTLRTTLEEQENVAADAVTPFLIRQKDLEARKVMEDYLRSRLEHRLKDEYELQKVEYDELNKKIARKEKEEQRLLQALTSVKQKMEAKAEKLDYDFRKAYLAGINLSLEEGEEEESNGAEDTENIEDIEQTDGTENTEDTEDTEDTGNTEDSEN